MLVHVWRDERILFHFYTVDKIDGSTTVRSASREEIVLGFRKKRSALAEFTSEDQFLSYVYSGAELMFEHKGRAVVLFELT